MSQSLRVAPEHIETVKNALQRQGFSKPEDLAKALGLSFLTIYDFVNGKPIDRTIFSEIYLELNLHLDAIIYEIVNDIDENLLNRDIPLGFKLSHVLRGHKKRIIRIKWSPDGKRIASPSDDNTIRIWDTETGKLLNILEGHSKEVGDVTWSPDNRILASGSADNTIKLWDLNTGKIIRTIKGHTELIRSVAWSPEGHILASASDDCTVRLWNPMTGELSQQVRYSKIILQDRMTCVEWSLDGKVIASASDDSRIRLYNIITNSRKILEGFEFYSHALDLAWSPDRRTIAVAYSDTIIRIWDSYTGEQKRILEGHTGGVRSVSFSCDGFFLASKALDHTIQIWRCDTWQKIATLYEFSDLKLYLWHSGLAFHPTEPILATLGEKDTVIRIWELDYDILLNQTPSTKSIHYMNAKAVLIGESGVGKSGLGIRMAEKEFRPTESTHGAQFWQIPVTKKIPSPSDNIEIQAELTLWDLAGQPDYHIVHQLFLNDTDVALLLFDCSDAAEPFKGVPYWAKVLQKQVPEHTLKYLISARSDVSPVTVSQREINQKLAEYELDGYFCTSAKTADGVEEVLQKILESIPWNRLPRTTTPKLFQVIREYLLERKEAGDTLLTLSQVQQEVTQRYSEPSQAELDTVISLQQARGFVFRLQPTPQVSYVLLKPELINQYASSIIQAARNHPQDIGAILERDVLCANFPITGFNRLEPAEEKIVLESTVELFINCDLCFREMGMLVFPSQLNAPRREPDSNHPPTEVTYEFSGSIEAIYASLVVRLSYTEYFQRHELRRYSAEFRCNEYPLGFAMEQVEEGTGELEIYFYPGVEDFDRITFIRFIIDHLRTKGIDIHERICLYCPNHECRKEVTNREAIEARVKAGKLEIPCQYCDTNIIIPESIEELYRSSADYHRKQEELKRTVEERTQQEVRQFKQDQQQYTMQQDNRLYLLHLSDIHLGTSQQAKRYRTQLESDLKNELRINRLHYLIISGDIANRSTKEEYDAAFEFVDGLVKRFGLDSSRVVIVPGNHDLNWDISEAAYSFIPKRKLPNPLPEGKYIPAGDAGALVRDENLYGDRFDYFSEYFYKKAYLGTEYPKDYSQQSIIHECPEDKILFLALNSCWQLDHHYKSRASINSDAIANAIDKILEKDYQDWLKIAVWHHPIAGQEAMNDNFLQQLAVNGFQICMHGHIHEAQEGFYKYDSNRGLHIIGAGTFGAPAKEQVAGIPLQYNLLCIEPETQIMTVETRKKEKVDGAWKGDARWGDANNPQPRYEIELHSWRAN